MVRLRHNDVNFEVKLNGQQIPSKCLKICFRALWMNFIHDLKIDLIMFEPHHVKLIFL